MLRINQGLWIHTKNIELSFMPSKSFEFVHVGFWTFETLEYTIMWKARGLLALGNSCKSSTFPISYKKILTFGSAEPPRII
jgi:hypothetical protein